MNVVWDNILISSIGLVITCAVFLITRFSEARKRGHEEAVIQVEIKHMRQTLERLERDLRERGSETTRSVNEMEKRVDARFAAIEARISSVDDAIISTRVELAALKAMNYVNGAQQKGESI